MPVTARLSKLFYDRLGEQIANELVEWFNSVDATYRADLRDLNERNFARFDAAQEARFARADANMETRFAQLETKWEARFAQLETKWEARFAQLETKWEARFGQIEVTLERGLKEQTRWMFVAWATLMVAILSLWSR